MIVPSCLYIFIYYFVSLGRTGRGQYQLLVTLVGLTSASIRMWITCLPQCYRYHHLVSALKFYANFEFRYAVQVRLRTEVLCTPSSAQPGFELMTSRSREYVIETHALTTRPSVAHPVLCKSSRFGNVRGIHHCNNDNVNMFIPPNKGISHKPLLYTARDCGNTPRLSPTGILD